jgi:hypothetical protein
MLWTLLCSIALRERVSSKGTSNPLIYSGHRSEYLNYSSSALSLPRTLGSSCFNTSLWASRAMLYSAPASIRTWNYRKTLVRVDSIQESYARKEFKLIKNNQSLDLMVSSLVSFLVPRPSSPRHPNQSSASIYSICNSLSLLTS